MRSFRVFMRRLRVCAKDGMFGFELAEGGGRLSRPYRFLYIRRNGSSVKNEPSLGRRGRIPFRFLQARRDFRRRMRAVCVVLSAVPVESGDVSGAWCDPCSRDGFRENGRTEDGSFPFGCSGRKRERPGYGFGGCGRFFACHGIHSSLNVKGSKARADSTTVALQAPHRISRIGAPCLFSVSAITCRHAPQGEHSREAGSEAIASARTFRPLRFDCT